MCISSRSSHRSQRSLAPEHTGSRGRAEQSEAAILISMQNRCSILGSKNMKPLTRILLSAACAAAFSAAPVTNGVAGGSHGGGGHSLVQHNQATHDANQNGAAKRPKSAAQPKPTVVRDHGDKNTKTTTTTSCSGRGHHGSGCSTVRDHTSGNQGDWHMPPGGPSGPAGGPNSRKPPS